MLWSGQAATVQGKCEITGVPPIKGNAKTKGLEITSSVKWLKKLKMLHREKRKP